MAFDFKICDGLIELTFHGKVSAGNLQQALQAVEDLESRLTVTPDRITDMSGADTAGLQAGDLVAVAEKRGKAKLKNKIKSAIVAPSPDHYGLARIFMGFNQNPDISLMIFRDSASAYQWLGRSAKSGDEAKT